MDAGNGLDQQTTKGMGKYRLPKGRRLLKRIDFRGAFTLGKYQSISMYATHATTQDASILIIYCLEHKKQTWLTLQKRGG